MAEVRKRPALIKRAETILKKAEDLFSDLMEEVGSDDLLTDYADNVVDTANDLVGLLRSGKK